MTEDLLRAALMDLIARMWAQPHIAPCPYQMGPDAKGNPTLIEKYGCICWIGPASDFLSAEVAALTPRAEAPPVEAKIAAETLDRVERAYIEISPDTKAEYAEESAESEHNRWTRVLTAVRFGLICPQCHAPAHRGAGKEKLDGLLEGKLMDIAPPTPDADGPATALDITAMRENLHATFNGGWREKTEIEAFHHGMDTVCNVLMAHQKGERTNGILPERAPSPPVAVAWPTCATCRHLDSFVHDELGRMRVCINPDQRINGADIATPELMGCTLHDPSPPPPTTTERT